MPRSPEEQRRSRSSARRAIARLSPTVHIFLCIAAERNPTLEGWWGGRARPHHGAMNSTHANKQIVEELISALFTDGDLTAIDRYLDPEFVDHDPPLPDAPDGPEGIRQAAALFRRAFPDWRSDDEHLIAEGDLVVEHFVAHGTHRGSVMGESPTGRDVVLRGINIFRIADGKIAERWGRLDDLGLQQQLGLLPAPAVASPAT